MPPTIKIKSDNATERASREAAARRVIALFDNRLPDSRLLCFFDDEDCDTVKEMAGSKANRGFYLPVLGGSGWQSLPDYVRTRAFSLPPVFDHVIYLHGSTCSNEVGLTMTFAHELQHFVQHRNAPELYAANALVR